MPKPTRADIMASRGASTWLKNALYDGRERDLYDALRDAETLAAVLRAEYKAAVAGEEAAHGPDLGGRPGKNIYGARS